MPKVLTFGQYVLFFWISEDGEPVHVHVAIKRPSEHATKFWLTSGGGCLLAHNGSDIPAGDLRDLKKLIAFNHRFICKKWVETYGADSLRFYR